MTQPPPRRPAAVDLAWGIQGGGRRGPKPARTLAELLGAAIAIADHEGIEALSMQRLAAELGFTPMAIYRYVASKEDLVMLVVDAAGGTPPPAPGGGADWRSGLEHWARVLLTVLREHPWISRVPIGGPPLLPNQVAWMESALGWLDATPLSMSERVAVMMLVASHVRSHHRFYDDMAQASAGAGSSPVEAERHMLDVLRTVADPERFPHVAAAFAVGAAEPVPDEIEADFEFGLARILDGVASLVAARGSTPR